MFRFCLLLVFFNLKWARFKDWIFVVIMICLELSFVFRFCLL